MAPAPSLINGSGLSELPLNWQRISNREPLRLEIHLTQTKQTTQTNSNREKEALFFGPSRGGGLPPSRVGSGCRFGFGLNARGIGNTHGHGVRVLKPLPYAEDCTLIGRKNRKWRPPFLLRLKPTPILCFVGVTENFNRTMLRLKQPAKRVKNEKGGGPSGPKKRPAHQHDSGEMLHLARRAPYGFARASRSRSAGC